MNDNRQKHKKGAGDVPRPFYGKMLGNSERRVDANAPPAVTSP